RLVRVQRRGTTEGRSAPSGFVATPELRGLETGVEAVLPAHLAPQFGPLVATVLDELEVPTVGDGHGVEFELRHLHDMRRAFVVEGPRIGGRPHLECAGGDPDAFGVADGSGARRFR